MEKIKLESRRVLTSEQINVLRSGRLHRRHNVSTNGIRVTTLQILKQEELISCVRNLSAEEITRTNDNDILPGIALAKKVLCEENDHRKATVVLRKVEFYEQNRDQMVWRLTEAGLRIANMAGEKLGWPEQAGGGSEGEMLEDLFRENTK